MGWCGSWRRLAMFRIVVGKATDRTHRRRLVAAPSATAAMAAPPDRAAALSDEATTIGRFVRTANGGA